MTYLSKRPPPHIVSIAYRIHSSDRAFVNLQRQSHSKEAVITPSSTFCRITRAVTLFLNCHSLFAAQQRKLKCCRRGRKSVWTGRRPKLGWHPPPRRRSRLHLRPSSRALAETSRWTHHLPDTPLPMVPAFLNALHILTGLIVAGTPPGRAIVYAIRFTLLRKPAGGRRATLKTPSILLTGGI